MIIELCFIKLAMNLGVSTLKLDGVGPAGFKSRVNVFLLA